MTETIALILAYVFVGINYTSLCKEEPEAPAILSFGIVFWPILLIVGFFIKD